MDDWTQSSLWTQIISAVLFPYHSLDQPSGLGTATSLTINGAAVNVDESVVSTLESSGGLTVDLTFAWGDAFGGKNPETYYTDGSYTGSATVFAATLNAFETAVKGASFTLTLTPVLD